MLEPRSLEKASHTSKFKVQCQKLRRYHTLSSADFFFPELTFISFPLAYLLSKGERVRMFQPCHSN